MKEEEKHEGLGDGRGEGGRWRAVKEEEEGPGKEERSKEGNFKENEGRRK